MSAASTIEIGYIVNLAVIDRCNAVFGIKNGRGYSQHNPKIPAMALKIWRIGSGLTAGSNAFVHMSQKILGQKKPCIAAAIWSARCKICQSLEFTKVAQQSTYR